MSILKTCKYFPPQVVLFKSFLQVWYDRRLNYTRSLAVMSMVGYMLGLGDR